MRRTPILVFLVSLLWLPACSEEQLREFRKGLQGVSRTEAGQWLLSRAVNWTAKNFAFTALGTPISIRDDGGKAIRGRWFIRAIEFKEEGNTLLATYGGEGYFHHPMAKIVTFRSVGTVRYRTEVRIENDKELVIFRPMEVVDVRIQGLRVSGLFASFIRGYVFSQAKARMRKKLEAGFTVVFDKKFKKNIHLGPGEPVNLPKNPWVAPEGSKTLANERVIMSEDGRDFLGPFKVKGGEVLQWRLKTKCRWGMDVYVISAHGGMALLAGYIDTSRRPQGTFTTLASKEGVLNWAQKLKFSIDREVWIIIDNSDAGKARPPTNMRNDELSVDVYVGKP